MQDVQAGPATATFGDRLAEAVDRKRSQLVIGLDPRPELLPVELRGGADLTVHPYSGSASVEPLVAACRRAGTGLFCLVKTSNAGSADVQELTLSDGRRVWQHVAELVAAWGEDLIGERGLSSVGAVVGATYPRAIGEARRLMPQAVLLLPGVGAQGAS